MAGEAVEGSGAGSVGGLRMDFFQNKGFYGVLFLNFNMVLSLQNI